MICLQRLLHYATWGLVLSSAPGEPECVGSCADLTLLQFGADVQGKRRGTDAPALAADMDKLEPALVKLAVVAGSATRLVGLHGKERVAAAVDVSGIFLEQWFALQARMLAVGTGWKAQNPKAAESVDKLLTGMLQFAAYLEGGLREQEACGGAEGPGLTAEASAEGFRHVWTNWEEAVLVVTETLPAPAAGLQDFLVKANAFSRRLRASALGFVGHDGCPEPVPSTAGASEDFRLSLSRGLDSLAAAVNTIREYDATVLPVLRASLHLDPSPEAIFTSRGQVEQGLLETIEGLLSRWGQVQEATEVFRSELVVHVPRTKPSLDAMAEAARQFKERMGIAPQLLAGLSQESVEGIGFRFQKEQEVMLACIEAFNNFWHGWQEAVLVSTEFLAGSAPATGEESQALGEVLRESTTLMHALRKSVYDVMHGPFPLRPE